MIMGEHLDGVVVLCGEPFGGYIPDDIRAYLDSENWSNAAVADAKSVVGMKIGWYLHEMNDPDTDEVTVQKYDREFKVWDVLEMELVNEIIKRLEHQNVTMGTKHKLSGDGYHYIIEPFMEQNGYRDGAGWWVKKKGENVND